MVYTLTRGVQGYNTRLHYSLYGGVEYFPDRSLALKELLPLVAVPAVAIALLVAIINFHIPILSPSTQSGSSDTGANLTRSAVTSSLITHPSSTNSSNSGATGSTNASKPSVGSTSTASSMDSTINSITGGMGGGEDNGQGIITPPDGGTTPVPTPPPTGSGTLSVNATTPVGSVTANADISQPTAPQAGVDVTVPLTNTNLSLGTGSLGL